MLSSHPQWRQKTADVTVFMVIDPLVVQDRSGGERRSAGIVSGFVIGNEVTLVDVIVGAWRQLFPRLIVLLLLLQPLLIQRTGEEWGMTLILG